MAEVTLKITADSAAALARVKEFARGIDDTWKSVRAGDAALAATKLKVSQLTEAKTTATKAAQEWTGALNLLPGQLGAVTSQVTSLATALRGPAGLVVGLGAVIAAGVGFAKSLANDVEHLDNLSRQTGLSVSALEAFEQAAREAGESPETLVQGLGKVNAAINDVLTGAPNAGKAFQAVGVNLRDLVRSGASAEDILEQTAKALADIPDPTRRAAMATELFGLRGRALTTVLDALAKEGFSGYIRAMREAGIVTTDATRAMAREVDRLADEFDRGWTGIVKRVKGSIAEIVAEIAKHPSLLAFPSLIPGSIASSRAERGERPPPQDPAARTLAPSAEQLQLEKELASLRQKSIEEASKAWGDYADQVLADDERMLQDEEKLRQARLQSAQAAGQFELKDNLEAIDKATKAFDDYQVSVSEALEDTLANNTAIDASVGEFQASGESMGFAGSMARAFREQLEGLPPSILAVRDASDETWIRTQQQIDEGVAAIFRMRDALGPPMLSAIEQFSAGFRQAGADLVAQFQSWEEIGRQTAGNLFNAFEESFFALMKGNLDDFDDIWKTALDAVLRQIVAFLASEAVQQLINLGTEIAKAASSSGGDGFDIFDPSTWFQRPRGTATADTQATTESQKRLELEQSRTGEATTQLRIEEARNAGGRVGGAIGGVVGGLVGGAAGTAALPGFGTIAGAELGRRGGRNLGEILGDLVGDLLGLGRTFDAELSPAATHAAAAAMNAAVAQNGLAEDLDPATAAANQAAQASRDLTAAQTDLAVETHDLTTATAEVTAATAETTAGLSDFNDGLGDLAAGIAGAVEAASAAAAVAQGAAAAASDSAADARGFAGTGPGQSPGPVGDPGGAGSGPSTGGGVSTGDSPDPSQGGKGQLHGGWAAGVRGYAPGGWVHDGVWGRDSVMAMLARGEFVLNAGAANYAPGFTEALNRDPARALAGVAAAGAEHDRAVPAQSTAALEAKLDRLIRALEGAQRRPYPRGWSG